MKFKLLSIKDRSRSVCYFCGTNKSVKYKSKIQQESGDEIKICSCNICILVHMNELVEF